MRPVDAYPHFWRLTAPGHVWSDARLPAIHGEFLPEDLRIAVAVGFSLDRKTKMDFANPGVIA